MCQKMDASSLRLECVSDDCKGKSHISTDLSTQYKQTHEQEVITRYVSQFNHGLGLGGGQFEYYIFALGIRKLLVNTKKDMLVSSIQEKPSINSLSFD